MEKFGKVVMATRNGHEYAPKEDESISSYLERLLTFFPSVEIIRNEDVWLEIKSAPRLGDLIPSTDIDSSGYRNQIVDFKMWYANDDGYCEINTFDLVGKV